MPASASTAPDAEERHRARRDEVDRAPAEGRAQRAARGPREEDAREEPGHHGAHDAAPLLQPICVAVSAMPIAATGASRDSPMAAARG